MIKSVWASCGFRPNCVLSCGEWGGGQVIGHVVENLVSESLLFGDSFVVVQNLDSLGKGEESEKEGDQKYEKSETSGRLTVRLSGGSVNVSDLRSVRVVVSDW